MSQGKLLYYQISLFTCLYIGYALYIYNRKGFSYLIPIVLKSESLSTADIGLIASSQSLMYLIGKFTGGILCDSFPARILFSLGLIGVGITMTMFSSVLSLYSFVSLQCINGLVQGLGWPPCVILLRKWFSPWLFATWWAVLSTSMNASGTIGPPVANWLQNIFDWRGALFYPALFTIIFGMIVFFIIHDSPSSVGLPEIQRTVSGSSQGRISKSEIFNYPYLLVICITYMCVSLLRGFLNDWLQVFLINERNRSQAQVVAFVSASEFGGIFGSLGVGMAADRLLAQPPSWLKESPRTFLLPWMYLGMFSCLHLIQSTVSVDSNQVILCTLGFVLGGLIYGIICLLGVAAVEAVPSGLSGTSHSIAALVANVGQSAAGLPLSLLAAYVHWGGVLVCLEVVCICAFVLLFLTRTYSPRLKVPDKAD